MTAQQIARIRRESMRRAIMVVGYNMRPADTAVRFVQSVLNQTQEYGMVHASELTNHVDYLLGKGLLERIEDQGPIKLWENVRLTPAGIDYMEGVTPAPDGVASAIIGE